MQSMVVLTLFVRWFCRLVALCFVLFIVLPIGIAASYQYAKGWPQSWNAADWSATGTAPTPRAHPEAIIRIYAARTGRWKSIFAKHTWIAAKPANATSWTRYDVVGWGRPVRVNAWPVDAKWYSNEPEIVYEIIGEKAASIIPELKSAVEHYPYAIPGDYRIWPGPNSNTFIAWVVRAVPGLDVELPAMALGKDFLGHGLQIARTPSNTGWQISWNGIAGAGLSWEEGLEVHVLGATVGIDPLDLAVKFPGVGRIAIDL